MSEVYFLSDLHFGHRKIVEFGKSTGTVYRSGDNYLENMHNIIQKCNSVVTKRDKLYLLGDTAFSQEGFDALREINGSKTLVRGNHDNKFSTEQWLQIFDSVEGIVKYKGFWLTHAPIHPLELRGKRNIHGHCVDAKTEILTVDGWKTWDTVSIGDVVYSLNKEGFLEYDIVDNIIVNDNYCGAVYEYKGKGLSLRVTDQHKMVFKTPHVPFQEELANKFFQRRSATIFKSGVLQTDNKISLSDDILKLYIALAADGNITKYKLCRFKLSKTRKIEKVKALLQDLSIFYSENVDINNMTTINFRLPKELIGWQIKGLDKKLLQCSKHQCEIIRDTYRWTDGHKDIIYTSKKGEVELLQHLFSINGYSATKHSRTGHGFSVNESYQLSVTDNSTFITPNIKSRVIKEEVTNELFWCVTVRKNGNFICRRNGTVHITGNCHQHSIRNTYTNELDPNYLNVSCEALGETPISLTQIKDGTYDLIRRC